jgi:hypothetical protein
MTVHVWDSSEGGCSSASLRLTEIKPNHYSRSPTPLPGLAGPACRAANLQGESLVLDQGTDHDAGRE